MMSTPEIPSTSAWWVLQISAKRSVADLVDEPDLPQRLLAVELLREHAPGEPAQLLVARGRRQRGVAHVVADVEVRVVDPHGRDGAERREREPLAVARDEVQAGVDVRDEVVVRRRRALEEQHGAHVHVGAVLLESQKGGVEAGQPVGVRHRA